MNTTPQHNVSFSLIDYLKRSFTLIDTDPCTLPNLRDSDQTFPKNFVQEAKKFYTFSSHKTPLFLFETRGFLRDTQGKEEKFVKIQKTTAYRRIALKNYAQICSLSIYTNTENPDFYKIIIFLPFAQNETFPGLIQTHFLRIAKEMAGVQ